MPLPLLNAARLTSLGRTIRGIRMGYLIAGVMLIAVTWTSIVWKSYSDLVADLDESQRNRANLAVLFEEGVLRTIAEIDKTLLYLRTQLEVGEARSSADAILRSSFMSSELIVQTAFIDETGMMRASTAAAPPTKPVDLSDREHFKVHQQGTLDRLFISKPVIGRASGKWSIQLTRRIFMPSGSFGGVVVGSLDPAHFSKFYGQIDVGLDGGLALVGHDGVIRASAKQSTLLPIGSELNVASLLSRVRSALPGDESHKFDGEHGEHHVHLRPIRGLPLTAVITTPKALIYASARSGFYKASLLGVAITVFTLIGMARLSAADDEALRKSEQLNRTLDNISQGIFLVTPDRRVPVINRRAIELLNLPSAYERTPPDYQELDRVLALGATGGQRNDLLGEDITSSASGNSVAIEFTTRERTSPSGQVLEIRQKLLADGTSVQTITDVTESRTMHTKVAEIAAQDALTGLANRRAFHSELQRLSSRLSGEPVDSEAVPHFALFCLDLDKFKAVNDTLGHPIGDKLLQAVSDRLRAAVRSTDFLARLGGDEFAVLVTGLRSVRAPGIVAARIVDALKKPYRIGDHDIQISCSIGIATAPHNGTDPDQLLVAADLALYAAKTGGRSTHRFFDPGMTEAAKARRAMELDLEQALRDQQLQLHYQPIVDLSTAKVLGFEALLRWVHPVKGFVSPVDFIPVAEECGLIVKIGEWVFQQACLDAVAWPNDLIVAVNLSGVQFGSPHLVKSIITALSTSGLSSSRLEVEITESVLLDDSARTIRTLHELKAIGLKVAMDDFGTGYSSLSYLQRFPFDKIKIDRSFVSKIDSDKSQQAIVKAVISIAGALDMTTTAEGVETAEQQRLLSDLGCREAQGYYFSKPMPSDRVAEYLLTFDKVMAHAA